MIGLQSQSSFTFWLKIHIFFFFFLLWLYSPILALGRLHETFRFISFTRSRTVGRTPWTGDQLVARPLLPAPGDCGDGELGGMNGFGRGNGSTRSKPAPTSLCSQEIPLARPGHEPGPPRWKIATNRFSFVAAVKIHIFFKLLLHFSSSETSRREKITVR
jgi:hypothetical protein